MKRCGGKCKQLLSEDQFGKRKQTNNGLDYYCKNCRKEYNKKWKSRQGAEWSKAQKKYQKGYYLGLRKEKRKRVIAYAKRPEVREAARRLREKCPERSTWHGMIYRCINTKGIGYKYYGGRGIKVCDRWLNSFEAFLEDVGKRPSPKHSIDRINNNGNYEPGNVKWATMKEQNQNKCRCCNNTHKLNLLLFSLYLTLVKEKQISSK